MNVSLSKELRRTRHARSVAGSGGWTITCGNVVRKKSLLTGFGCSLGGASSLSPQVLSVTLFEKTPILRAFHDQGSQEKSALFSNQLNLLDF
jgi:hypothetical protein